MTDLRPLTTYTDIKSGVSSAPIGDGHGWVEIEFATYEDAHLFHSHLLLLRDEQSEKLRAVAEYRADKERPDMVLNDACVEG